MTNEKNRVTQRNDMRRRTDLARKPVKPKQDVEVIALEIDEDFDLGGDPYNHTGSHCIVKLRDD